MKKIPEKNVTARTHNILTSSNPTSGFNLDFIALQKRTSLIENMLV